MDIKLKDRWKLARQAFYSATNFNGNKPVKIATIGGLYQLETEGKHIYVPSAQRWKLYRWGWAARLDRLRQEYAFGRELPINEGSTVIDIGANAGEFAFIAAQAGARCLCIEPDPLVNLCARLNTTSLAKIRVYDDLLWRENTEIDFHLAPQRADSSVFSVSDHAVKKQAVTLADFMAREGIERADFIKCDAEGAEPEVLEGAEKVHHAIGFFAVDTGAERNGERTHEASEKIFKSWGFKVMHEKIGTRWMTYGVNLDFKY